MAKLLKYESFLNEKKLNLDNTYEYLKKVTKKCNYEQSQHFYMKEPIEIGTCKSGKFYLNYLSVNYYDDHLAFWIIYNERPDKLFGTSWDSSVIWEEEGKLNYIDENIKEEFKLYPNFMEIIAEKIKSYDDLDNWCKYLVDLGLKSRKYHRWAISASIKDKLTWDERIEWTKNQIEIDKLLNRHSKPVEEKRLKDMLTLGEVEYDKKMNKQNKEIEDILKEMDL
jgi:hypothetical protein